MLFDVVVIIVIDLNVINLFNKMKLHDFYWKFRTCQSRIQMTVEVGEGTQRRAIC